MNLLNIAYVEDFMTNFVFMTIFSSKKVYSDNKQLHLYQDAAIFAYVRNHNSHYLMENNLNILNPATIVETSIMSDILDLYLDIKFIDDLEIVILTIENSVMLSSKNYSTYTTTIDPQITEY